jgi:hypothetical protein
MTKPARSTSRAADRSAGRSLGRTLGSLALAVLNATLILLALCLWLAWHVLSEARAISGALAEGLAQVSPVGSELAGLRAEVAGLRGDLAGLQGQGEGVAALGARLAALDTRLAVAQDRLDAALTDPGPLIDRAVDRAAYQVRAGIAACTAVGA